ncbi:hypothetical protein ACHAWF_003305, partial [Thalassiosira exigua]
EALPRAAEARRPGRRRGTTRAGPRPVRPGRRRSAWSVVEESEAGLEADCGRGRGHRRGRHGPVRFVCV